MDKIYFKNLDIIRFIAAYFIVVLHTFYAWKANYGYPSFMASNDGHVQGAWRYLERAIANTSIGVDIFFIISGFLITYLLLAEREKSGGVDILKFYIRRAFRIWPLYFCLLLIAPLLTYYFGEPESNYFYHFIFLGNFDVIKHGIGSIATNHLWSICVEEHYYLVAPLIIALVPMRKIPQVLLSIIGMSILFRISVQGNDNYWNIIYMHTFSRIDMLAFGSLLGYFMFTTQPKFNHPLSLRLIFYAILILLFLNDDIKLIDTIFLASMKKYIYGILIAYWAANYIFNPDARYAPKKENFFHQLGKISYGIYMFNPIVISLVLKYFQSSGNHNFLIYVIVVHLCIYAISSLSYNYIELPFLHLKEKFGTTHSSESKPHGKAQVLILKRILEKVSRPTELTRKTYAQFLERAEKAEVGLEKKF